MNIVVYGYHDIGCCAIQTLREMGEKICAVFTHDDDPRENVWFGSVKKLALELHLPVFTTETPNSTEWVAKVAGMKPDIIFSFYYRQLISESILAIPPKGALNLHGSLLPKYRGRAPVNWALVNGEKETGLTLHYMLKKADAGDIVAQKRAPIVETDTALSLFKKLVPLTREILLESVPLLARGAAPRVPQDHSQATTYRGRKPEDGKIDWTKSAEEVYNLIRAVTHPYPGAFALFGQKKIFIWTARKQKNLQGASLKPGTISSLDPLLIACGLGELLVEKIQTESEPELTGPDWAKKHVFKTGTCLS